MQLRDYQIKGKEDLRSGFRSGHKRGLYVASTGAGKTVTFVSIVLDAVAKGSRVWIIAHREKLIRQAGQHFKGMKFGFISPKFTEITEAQIQICMVQTLIKRIDRLPAPDIIIIDEAHRSLGSQYVEIIKRHSKAILIGFTATPQRTDGRGLSEMYDFMAICSKTTKQLIDEGHLSKYKYFSAEREADFSRAKQSGGDYRQADRENITKESGIIGDCVKEYERHAKGKSGLVFTDGIASAHEVAVLFNEAGYSAVAISGKDSTSVQNDALLGLETGKYLIVVSCDLLSEGVDVPSVTYCGMLRATTSIVVFLQQIGRVLRYFPDKVAIIVDHVQNWKRHDFPCTDREWSLEGEVKRPKERGEEAFRCPKCLQMFPIDVIDPNCGYDPNECMFRKPKERIEEAEKAIQEELKRIELEELNVEQIKRDRARMIAQAESISELKEVAKILGYNQKWAYHIFNARKSK